MRNENVNKRYFSITSITKVLLAAIVAISFMILTTTDNVFARNDERYAIDGVSQSAVVNNDCLNPLFDSNTIDNAVGVANCGGTISQQDESGQATTPIVHQTANPIIEVQRSTPDTATPPETCEECITEKSMYISFL
jgi:hypothetical protein